jgi:hypothetical protein
VGTSQRTESHRTTRDTDVSFRSIVVPNKSDGATTDPTFSPIDQEHPNIETLFVDSRSTCNGAEAVCR